MAGSGAPRGVPKMPNVSHFKGVFRAFIFPAHLYPPTSLHTFSDPPPFHPVPPFPKEVNKKLSYHRQNGLSIVKTHRHNIVGEHMLFLHIRQSRLAGGILLWTCAFVRPSIHPSITNWEC